MSSLGSVTSLGVGSGFDLQSMLDNFKKIDQAPIDSMNSEITDIKERMTKFDEIKTKLLDMKSHALNLSLQSSFIERGASVSDETIAGATATQGASITTSSLDIQRLATKNSWQTGGVAGADTSTYIPTVQESTTAFDNTNQASAISADNTMTITHGSGDTEKSVTVALTKGMTLDQIVSAVNTDTENNDGAGGTYLTASTFADDDGKYHLRISSTAAGSTESNRVMFTSYPTELPFQAPDVTFTYTLGSNDSVEVSVPADTTFTELASLINDGSTNPGVTATVINDGTGTTPYHLVLTADNTGEDNRIAISGMEMTEVQGADGASLNAELSVNGITYQRQSNTGINDVLQGVTLELKKVGETSLTVSADSTSVKSDITDFISTYNEMVQFIKTESSYDSDTKTWGPLSSVYSIKSLPNDINTLLGTSVETGGSVKSMYDLGMEINRDGTVTINETTLDSALASSMDSVSKLFLGDSDAGITGIADKLNDKLLNMTSTSGAVESENTYSQDKIDRLDTKISEDTEKLQNKYNILANQFVQLDSYLGKMKAEANYLTQIFDSYNNSGNNSSNSSSS